MKTIFLQHKISIILVLLAITSIFLFFPNIVNLKIFAQSENNTLQNDLSLPDLFSQVEGSVVQVTDIDNSHEIESRLGSGFVYDTEGHIITNYHVIVPNSPNKIQVTFLDGGTYFANLVGFDPFADVAVLKVRDIPVNKLKPLSLADSASLRVGETVVAIGNPFGLSGSMTVGVVSGLGRLLPSGEGNIQSVPSFSIPDIIQTDAAINPGNSGGPLINTKGEIVGINTAIFSNTGVYSGVGFAVPSNTIKKVVPSLIQTGTYKHPYLGITGLDITPELTKLLHLDRTTGFLITGITKGSPAERYGLLSGRQSILNGKVINVGGDIVLRIDEQEIKKIDNILSYLEREKQAGDTVHLLVDRDGIVKELELVLGSRPTFNGINPLSSSEPQSDQFRSDNDRNSNDNYYNQCIMIAGKDLCDFLFRR